MNWLDLRRTTGNSVGLGLPQSGPHLRLGPAHGAHPMPLLLDRSWASDGGVLPAREGPDSGAEGRSESDVQTLGNEARKRRYAAPHRRERVRRLAEGKDALLA